MQIEDLGNICLWCFEAKGDSPLCPHCGHDERDLKVPEQALPAGTIIGNHYLLGKVLGQGGFGITYLAYDRDLRVKRAVKEFFPQGMVVRDGSEVRVSRRDAQEDFKKGVESFYSEAKSIARFGEHPNIVKVHDLFHENGTVYFVMDYIEGESFQQYLKNHGNRIPLDEALSILRPIGDALTALHQAHLLHRDVKPDNIFITKTGIPILLDFGAARYETKERTNSKAAVLTPGFAPPEQYGSIVHQGPCTDVYALAATFYRALSGAVPIASSDRILEDILMPLNQLDPKVPLHVSAAVSHAMEIKITDRTSSVEQFFRELDPGKKRQGIPLVIILSVFLAVCALGIFFLSRERFHAVPENTVLPGLTETAAEPQTLPTAEDTKLPAAAEPTLSIPTETLMPAAEDTELPAAAEPTLPIPTQTPVPAAAAVPFQLPESVVDIEDAGWDFVPDTREILQAQVGGRVHFGHLDQDNEPRTGRESILWRVLARDAEKVLLVSEYALDVGRFNERKEATYWAYSSLRTWLNEDFYQEAFSDEEQAMILQSKVPADRNSRYALNDSRDSLDRIFLLSVSEAETYFADDWDRVCRPTARSLLNGATMSDEQSDPAGVSWWLRTAGEDQFHAAYVMEDGSIRYTGADVDRSDFAVRPAFWLNISEVQSKTACTTAETCFYNALLGDENALELIREKAEQRDDSAQCLMGYLSSWGAGAAQDETAAADWFRLAAEQGSVEGQYALGALQLTGSKTPEAAAEAVEWFRRAAEQGNSSAQYRLAALYEQGLGVPENGSAAALWYQLAAVSTRSAVFDAGYEKPRSGVEILIAQAGDRLYYGHLDQDRNTANGAEPVLWRVLKRENDRLLLISEHGLNALPYHETLTEVSWETSTLRAWLNETFYETVFSGAEKAGILETGLPARSFFENDTIDKIFLLNITEASQYFADSQDRQCVPSANALSRHESGNENSTSAWWLWDSGSNEDLSLAAVIDAEGQIYDEGLEVDKENVLVRPAFWLSLSDVSFW